MNAVISTTAHMADTDTNKEPISPAVPELPHDPLHKGHIESDLPRMRTFAEDLSVEIQRKGTTAASIVEAERARAARAALQTGVDESEPRRRTILAGAALFFLIAGVVGLGSAYVWSSLSPTVEERPAPTLISANNTTAVLESSYEPLTDTLGTLRSGDISLGEVAHLAVTLSSASTTPQALLAALNAPEPLVREATEVMLGFHSFNRIQPFIIVRIAQYDRAFAAMLQWEPDMARALGSFFKPVGGGGVPTLAFTDVVIRNTDARVSQDSWPLLWTFVRRDLLVITTNQYTLSEILTRLAAQPGAVQ